MFISQLTHVKFTIHSIHKVWYPTQFATFNFLQLSQLNKHLLSPLYIVTFDENN